MLEQYYKGIAPDIYFVDFDAYQSAGITFDDLRALGVTDKIIIPAIMADSLSGERPETFAGNSALISWKRPFSTSPSMRKLKTP